MNEERGDKTGWKREKKGEGGEGVEERVPGRWSPVFRINTSTASLGVPSGSLFAPFPTLIPLSHTSTTLSFSYSHDPFLSSPFCPLLVSLSPLRPLSSSSLTFLFSSPFFYVSFPRCFPLHCFALISPFPPSLFLFISFGDSYEKYMSNFIYVNLHIKK